jgi:hypothetical protein
VSDYADFETQADRAKIARDVKRFATQMVLASDYDALQSRVATLTAEVMHYTSGTPHPLQSQVDALRAVLAESKREHLVVDGDCWYSCPKSGQCCNDSEDKDHCNCGADRWNARVDAALSPATGEKS